ncbi:hypothetical protein OSB04_024868 [Centaurea solstitialis]|uniref:Uncharacterized protein n=1 Tax=Centaurea solstitialis TaxID=347529 RepID=A0AA38T0D1_9ASTR|nr:hypothetical protein OSB04_024868 [Centaurea solstitialis]
MQFSDSEKLGSENSSIRISDFSEARPQIRGSFSDSENKVFRFGKGEFSDSEKKDLGEATYILGIKIYRNKSRRLIGISQGTYIDKILKRFRMDESTKGFIPMQHGIVLSKAQCPVSSKDQDKMKSVPYASAIGSIMYAMLCTRPDVAYSISVTSRYQLNPGSEDEISVTGYTDASFQTDIDDFKSQSDYVFTLNGGTISLKSSKQDTIADSTTEAEYIAASDAAKEAVWLRNFISDLRVVASISRPVDIYCDNSGAVTQAKEPREHHKSRHVLRKYHHIREIIGRGDVRICKIPTDENVADPLTKPLARIKYEGRANPYIELQNQVKDLALKVYEYDKKIKKANNMTTVAESKLASEHALVLKFSIKLAHSKDKVNMLSIAKKTIEDNVASLNDNITDLQKKLNEAELLSRVSVQKYDVIFAQRTNLFEKIKDMEHKFPKRGQTDQTIHMNQPKEFNYYNPKEGIGYKSPCYLKRAISKTHTMYDLRYMSLGYKIVFMKESDDPEQLMEIEKKEKDRKNKHSIPFNYTSLNASYAAHEIPLSKDYTPSYTEAEMNQEVPILSKIFNDNRTFFEKRTATLEADLEDERRMSLRENDLFLSKINELEKALKSKSTSKSSQSTFGTRDNSRHHHHTWNVNALDFRPSSTFSQNSNSMVLRSPICTTISYMDDITCTAPKTMVRISEIVSDDCTNRVGENGRSPGTSKPGNFVPTKAPRKDKG